LGSSVERLLCSDAHVRGQGNRVEISSEPVNLRGSTKLLEELAVHEASIEQCPRITTVGADLRARGGGNEQRGERGAGERGAPR
jgi:hypothetical protein